jgi:hypothetical protein
MNSALRISNWDTTGIITSLQGFGYLHGANRAFSLVITQIFFEAILIR